jgi:drug/metabolite transporter (DMT)-like permease
MQELSFPYPMFLSGGGVAFSGLVAYVLVGLGFVQLKEHQAVEGILYIKRVVPVGVAYAGTLAVGNMVYLLLDVGFIQMLKSFTPVVVMAFLFVFGIESPSRPVIISIFFISIGTAVTCSYTPNASILGILVMLLSEVFEAVRLVLTQFLLKDLKFGIVEGQYVLSPASAFCLFGSSLIYEVPRMIETKDYRVIWRHPLDFVSTCMLGVAVNFLSYFVIQRTSSLTLKVLVMFRNFMVIVVGIIYYGEETSTNEFLGYGLALIGFVG